MMHSVRRGIATTLLAACLPVIYTTNAHAADVEASTSKSGEWTTATLWTNLPAASGYPNNGAQTWDATILTGGSISLDAAVSIQSFTLAGTLSGTGNLTVNSSSTWTGGNLIGTGTLTIANTTFTVSAPTGSKLYRSVNNSGTLAFTASGSLAVGGGAILANSGTIDFRTDASWIRDSTALATVKNSGLFEKSGGTGVSAVSAFFTNNSGGTLSVSSGTLDLLSNGSGAAGSHFNTVAGSTLQFGAGTYTIASGAVISNSGTVLVSSALEAPASVLSGANVTLNGAELAINGDLNDNQFNWVSGTLTGPGTTQLTADRNFSTPWGVAAGRTLDTNGHNFTWSDGAFDPFDGASAFGLSGTATISIAPASTFQVNVVRASTLNSATLANAETNVQVNNAGTFVSNGAGTLTVGAVYNNAGVTSVVGGGTLQLLNGGTSSGTFNGDAGSTLIIAGSVANEADVSSTINADNLQFGIAQQNHTGAFLSGGTTNFSGSATANAITIAGVDSGSTTDASQSSFTLAEGAVLIANNTVQITGGSADLQGNVNVPAGTLSVAGATYGSGSNAVTVQATATVEPTATVNAGNVVVADSGSLYLPAGATVTAGNFYHTSEGGNQPYTEVASATLNVTNQVSLLGGTLNVHGSSASVSANSIDVGVGADANTAASLNVSDGAVVTAVSYSQEGNLTLQNGTVRVTGAAPAALNSTAFVSGGGTIDGSVSSSGTIAPATYDPDQGKLVPNTLHITGNLSLQHQTNDNYDIEIDGGTKANDQIAVGKNADLGGGFIYVSIVSGTEGTITATDQFTILTGSNVTGAFTGTQSNGGKTYVDAYDDGSGDPAGYFVVHYNPTSVVLDGFGTDFSAVPEPATLLSGGTLLAALLRRPTRKRRR